MSVRSVTDPAIDVQLLHTLLTAAAPMSIDALAATTQGDRARTLAALNQLQAAGSTLARDGELVTLGEAGLGTWVDYVQAMSGRAGRRINVYRETGSTQDACRRLVERSAGPVDGTTVAADSQSAGRGRLGRQWIVPPGRGLTFSVACALDRPHTDAPATSPASSLDAITFATAVAIARAIETVARGLSVRIKWPNDVYVDGRKLAGILVETFGRTAIVGIGINCGLRLSDLPPDTPPDTSQDAPPRFTPGVPDLRSRITSLHMLGRDVDRLLVLNEALVQLDLALTQPIDSLLDAWRARSVLLSRHVRVRSEGVERAGHVVDLDPTLGLILHEDTGALTYLRPHVTTILDW